MNDQTKLINFSRTPNTPEDFLQIFEEVREAFFKSDAIHTDTEHSAHVTNALYKLQTKLTYLDGAFKKGDKANTIKSMPLKYDKDFFKKS